MSVPKRFKVVLLGDHNSGKSVFLNTLITKKFTNEYIPTLGVDVRSLPVETNIGNIILDFWDTAGPNYKGLGSAYYRGADLGILCVPVTSSNDVNELLKKEWNEVNPDKPLCVIDVKNTNDYYENTFTCLDWIIEELPGNIRKCDSTENEKNYYKNTFEFHDIKKCDSTENEKRFKVVLLGDNNTGKTTLITKLVTKKFLKEYIPTLGVNVYILPVKTNKGNIILDVWDTAGPSHEGLGSTYFCGADLGVMCETITSSKDVKNQLKEEWLSINPDKQLTHVNIKLYTFDDYDKVIFELFKWLIRRLTNDDEISILDL